MSKSFSSYSCVLAVDAFTSKNRLYNAFEDVAQYQQTTKDWFWLSIL
jgi:para-aminobenzoate synthetase component 1